MRAGTIKVFCNGSNHRRNTLFVNQNWYCANLIFVLSYLEATRRARKHFKHPVYTETPHEAGGNYDQQELHWPVAASERQERHNDYANDYHNSRQTVRCEKRTNDRYCGNSHQKMANGETNRAICDLTALQSVSRYRIDYGAEKGGAEEQKRGHH
jgi:hypothetical protein